MMLSVMSLLTGGKIILGNHATWYPTYWCLNLAENLVKFMVAVMGYHGICSGMHLVCSYHNMVLLEYHGI